MAETRTREKTDWVTPLAITVGGAALIGGVLFFLRGKETAAPGDILNVTFKFDYRGPMDSYRLRIVLGNARALLPFDEDPVTLQEYTIVIEASDEWVTHEEMVEYEIPLFGEGVSDAEFSIRYSDNTIVNGWRIIARDIVKRE